MQDRPTPTVDCHVHFWDLALPCYQWITEKHGVLHRNHLPADLEPRMPEAGVSTAVAVQAANSLEDTRFLLRCAEQTEWVGAVVGWIPLDSPEEASEAMDAFVAHPKFRGVRHLLGLLEVDPDWLIRSSVLESLGLLAERGLVFEVQAEYPKHLEHVPVIAEAVPDLITVIGHLAKPPIRRQEEFDSWASQIDAAARYPNVYAKVSGMNTVTGPEGSWAMPFRANAFKRFVDHALASFGPTRLIVGSNWPVCLTAGDAYRTVWCELRNLFAGTSPDDMDALFGATAARLFHLSSAGQEWKGVQYERSRRGLGSRDEPNARPQ